MASKEPCAGCGSTDHGVCSAPTVELMERYGSRDRMCLACWLLVDSPAPTPAEMWRIATGRMVSSQELTTVARAGLDTLISAPMEYRPTIVASEHLVFMQNVGRALAKVRRAKSEIVLQARLDIEWSKRSEFSVKPVPDDCPPPVPPDGEWAHAFDAGARRRRKGFDLPPRQRNYYNAWLRTGWTRQDELFSEYQLHMANRVRLHAGQKR